MDEILKLFGGIDNLWAAIKENASKVGVEVTRVMLELFYVLKSPETSMLNKSLIVAALGYQLLPEDVLPRDKYGLLGFLDNGITLALAYNRVKSSVTPQIEQQVNNVLTGWFGTDNDSTQQEWSSSGNETDGGYAPRPLFQNPGYQNPSMDDFLRNSKKSVQRNSDWEDEDIVID